MLIRQLRDFLFLKYVRTKPSRYKYTLSGQMFRVSISLAFNCNNIAFCEYLAYINGNCTKKVAALNHVWKQQNAFVCDMCVHRRGNPTWNATQQIETIRLLDLTLMYFNPLLYNGIKRAFNVSCRNIIGVPSQ